MSDYHWDTCCKCHVRHAIPIELFNAAKQRGSQMMIYCPNGHQYYYPFGETEEQKIRRERDRLVQKIAEKDDEIKRQKGMRERAERSARAYKGKVTRLKNRAASGLCPCCNRTFQNLRKHMTTKHPEYKNEED